MKTKKTQLILKIPLILLTVVVLFSFGVNSAAAANASTIYVNTTGNNSWDGQSAIWNGTSGPKQTISNATGTVTANGIIYIAQGTYNESGININKNMAIIGENEQNTIIDGRQIGDPIFSIVPGVTVTISNLTLTNNVAAYGGAIYNDGSLTVTNSTFKGNSAYNDDQICGGGAIYNDGSLTVTNSTFEGNIADNYYLRCWGGAIFNDNGILMVTNSTFEGNIALGDGGAICNDGSLTVHNSTFNGNSAYADGGAIVNFGSLTVTDSTLENNSAALGEGGAIFNRGGSLTVTNLTLKNNTQGMGGAINYGLSLTPNPPSYPSLNVTISKPPNNGNSSTGNTTTNNNSTTMNAATQTVAMQNTGVPMAGFALAILSVLGGILIPRKK
ncbi:MAG: hypothetical protein K8E24_007205 [Methanobacterium paludis]|nr:hypothetical protein [Methanobacterium paludis]